MNLPFPEQCRRCHVPKRTGQYMQGKNWICSDCFPTDKEGVSMPKSLWPEQAIATMMKKNQPPPNAGTLLKMLRSQCKQLEAAGEDKLLTQEVRSWWEDQKEDERIRDEAARKKKEEEIQKKLVVFNKLKKELEMDGVI